MIRWRAHATSIALTLIAAGALVYAYVDRGSVSVSEKKSREGNVVPAWRREDLAGITIDRDGAPAPGAEHIVLERRKDDAGDGEWWMRAPRDERADAEACDKLASALELASVVRKVDPGVHAPGLDAPRARVEIRMGSLTYRLVLGGEAPTPAGAAYAQLEGAGAVVVSKELASAILQGAGTYRSRVVVPYLSFALAKLEVKGEAGTLAIERADDVSFKLSATGLRASRTKLDAVWGALGEARAEAFVGDDVADPLVKPPRVTITMTPKDGSRAVGVLRVGAACPGYPDDVAVVRDAPSRVSACAPKGILAGLETTDAALADPRLFAAHDDEVSELRLETTGKGAALDLARKEGGWRERAPAERDLNGEEAEAAAALAKAVAAAEGADPARVDGPFDAAARVTLHRAEGDVAEVVELAAPDAAGDVVARRTFDGARLHVAAAVARKLVPRAVALRGPEPWTPRIEGVPVASVETRCEDVEQRAVHDGDAWTLRAPAGYDVDNTSVLDLIDAVTRARAIAWVADADDGRFGFGSGACAIALGLRGDGGERVVRVELGREGEGGVYARTEGDGAVFVAPKGLRDRAHAWLVNQHAFAPPSVDAVTLERDGKRRTFSADAGAGDATDAVLAAANVLRGDGVSHLGPARTTEGFAHPTLVATLRAGKASKRVVFGAETAGEGKARSLYARVDGVDATFSVDRDRVKSLLDSF